MPDDVGSSNQNQAAGAAANPPSRFAWGLALGVGIGAIAVAALLAAGYFGSMYYMARNFDGSSRPSSYKAVDAGEWFTLDSSGRGTMTGYSNGWGSGDGMPSGTVGAIDLTAAGVYGGIPVAHSIQVFVSRDTAITVGGKPWAPSKSSGTSPVEAIFEEDEVEGPLDSRELTVRVRKVGDRLVAESIDASTAVLDGPMPWEMEY